MSRKRKYDNRKYETLFSDDYHLGLEEGLAQGGGLVSLLAGVAYGLVIGIVGALIFKHVH